MPPDSFGASLTAEIRNIIGTRGQPLRQTLAAFVIPLLVLVGFGILVPLSKGLDFFDPLILGAYASLGGIFAGPAAATAALGAGRRRGHRHRIIVFAATRGK